MIIVLTRAIVQDVRQWVNPANGEVRVFCEIVTTDSRFKCTAHGVSEKQLKDLSLVPIHAEIDLVLTRANNSQNGHYIDVRFIRIQDPLAAAGTPPGAVAGKPDNPIKGALDGNK